MPFDIDLMIDLLLFLQIGGKAAGCPGQLFITDPLLLLNQRIFNVLFCRIFTTAGNSPPFTNLPLLVPQTPHSQYIPPPLPTSAFLLTCLKASPEPCITPSTSLVPCGSLSVLYVSLPCSLCLSLSLSPSLSSLNLSGSVLMLSDLRWYRIKLTINIYSCLYHPFKAVFKYDYLQFLAKNKTDIVVCF